MPGINLKLADEFAVEYDNSVLRQNWRGPEILFNLVIDFIKPCSKILDLGIGTGESSVRFRNEGHKIIGVDGSVNMITECKKKEIVAELVLHDLENFLQSF